MTKWILAGLICLLLAVPAGAYFPDVQDITIYPLQADLVTTEPQYSQEVTATATDTEVAIDTFYFEPYMGGDILWAYFDLDVYLKADASATADIIWRIEARNKAETAWKPIDKYFTITSSNDVMEWETSASKKSVDTADGVYTGATLAAAMQTAIRAETALAITTATVTYSTTTHKFTIDGVTKPISCAFANSDMATTIGFDRDLSAATEQTSRFAVPAHYEANIGTTYVEKNYKGYVNLFSGSFDEVPFDVRVVFQCNEGAEGKGKISSNSFIRALFKEHL